METEGRIETKKKNMEINCEFCNKLCVDSKLLKHIGSKKACKSFYGPRFQKMKKDQAKKKRAEKNHNMWIEEGGKQYKKFLKRKRKLYAKNEELREKRRNCYQEKKQEIKEKNEG